MNYSSKPDSENSPQDNSEIRRQSIVPIAPLPEHISQNIETIIALHTRNEQDVSGHQRGVEAVTPTLKLDKTGQPCLIDPRHPTTTKG
ncbi:hypothetical protein PI95_004540 [Hassallia byssoidea VB512170]|uniref:Uncharacterized protein n=1 Tax=Hassallia byssoidea VB512170 TaxID=1304833 RepID=A0A846H5J5_9CYAN|nr:hypothetical protein [Hassalia byssoidea]NEU71859.1 hypothetical protein [Hassalia byssoidea VB512170]